MNVSEIHLPKDLLKLFEDALDLVVDIALKDAAHGVVAQLDKLLAGLAGNASKLLPPRPALPAPPVPANVLPLNSNAGLKFIDLVLNTWVNASWDWLVDRLTPGKRLDPRHQR